MAHSFKLPDLGEGLTEGEVARWLVSEGQEVAEDDPLVEIQTDKATVEIPSPYAGTVLQILVAEGKVAPVGAVLVVIGEAGEALPEAPSPTDETRDAAGPVATAPTGRVAATPLVRKVAQELGVDLATVTGTGPGGRITDEDVRAAADGGAVVSEGRREPLRGVRRLIAEHMTRAHREVPPVTWVEECDFEGVELDRLLATVVKAVADTLLEFPELNARLDGDAIVYLDRYDIGVAVQTEQGLVVPVVRGADSRSPDELDTEIRRLADGARAGSLKPEEVRGLDVHRHERGQARGTLPDSDREPPGGRDRLRSAESRRGRSSGTARSLVRAHGHDRDHLRPPGRRRRPRRRVRARGDSEDRERRLGGLSPPAESVRSTSQSRSCLRSSWALISPPGKRSGPVWTFAYVTPALSRRDRPRRARRPRCPGRARPRARIACTSAASRVPDTVSLLAVLPAGQTGVPAGTG